MLSAQLNIHINSPVKLIGKLNNRLEYNTLKLDIGLLRSEPQRVQIGSHASSTLELNTGVPQGCLLSPLQFTLHTLYTAMSALPTNQENSTPC